MSKTPQAMRVWWVGVVQDVRHDSHKCAWQSSTTCVKVHNVYPACRRTDGHCSSPNSRKL